MQRLRRQASKGFTVTDQAIGFHDISEEDRKKAQTFFTHGETVARTGNSEYAIELYLQGLERDPEAVAGHQALRDIALKRTALGGKSLGMFEAIKLRRGGKDEKQNMLAAEKLLAYQPGNTDPMSLLFQAAFRGGFYDTALWIGPILLKANTDQPKPEFAKYILLKDTYKAMASNPQFPEPVRTDLWRRATEACNYAALLRPDDMDLQTELKHLGAQQTMTTGRYEEGGNFRQSVRNMDAQRQLMQKDTGIKSDEVMDSQLRQAQAEFDKDPQEPGKIARLVEALRATGDFEHENRAIDVLKEAFERTGQFRFRHQIGLIALEQLRRMERQMREQAAANPKDAQLAQDYRKFRADMLEKELAEFQLFAENYPTDLTHRHEAGKRLFMLGRFDQAIPVFQQSRQDSKLRNDATLLLGRSFLEAGFPEEAVDTLRGLIESYPIRDDERAKHMNYWYGRALEAKGDLPTAIKSYSLVTQIDFNFLDVQKRMRELRAKTQAG